MIVDFIEFLIFIRVVFAKIRNCKTTSFCKNSVLQKRSFLQKELSQKKAYALSPIGSKSSVPLFQRSSMPRVMS